MALSSPRVLAQRQATLRLGRALVFLALLACATLENYKAFSQQLRGTATEDDEESIRAADSIRQMLFQFVSVDKVHDSDMLYQIAHIAGREDLARPRMQSSNSGVNSAANPIATIVERARRTSIVIINEDHSSPLHRHFVGEVLRALAKEGYCVYAAETFSDTLTLNAAELFARDGFYSQEPIFGRTVQLAKSLGYELVAYEQTDAQRKDAEKAGTDLPSAREESQKDNLISKIFESRPHAKTVIHVGGSHLLKKPVEAQGNLLWMAARLKAALDVEPLAISQVGCLSKTDETVIATGRLTAAGVVSAEAEGVDLYVGHPKVKFTDHRPAWRRTAGDVEFEIPGSLRSDQEIVIVEARGERAAACEVPTDRILIRPGERIPLLLPPGRYALDAYTRSGKLNQTPLIVEVR